MPSSKTLQQQAKSFELYTGSILSKYGFHLTTTPKSHDHGIDLYGSWNLPSCKKPLNSIIQCKYSKHRLLSVNIIREFEGVMSNTKLNYQAKIGILASPIGFTRSAYKRFFQSIYPLGLVTINNKLCDFQFNHQTFELLPDLIVTHQRLIKSKQKIEENSCILLYKKQILGYKS